MGKALTLTPSELDIDEVYADLTLPAGKGNRPYVVFNMVSTADGKATIGGRSHHVGSPVDHILMRRVRAAVDMILIGAGTLRGENINFSTPAELQQLRVSRGLAPTPIAAVLSPSADLPLQRTFFASHDFESIVLTTRRADPEKLRAIAGHARVIYVGDKDVDIVHLMTFLFKDLGIKRLAVEGGPTLNYTLMQTGFADELFLTVAPRVVGGREKTIVQGDETIDAARQCLTLVSCFSHDNELYLRYRF